MPVSESNFLRLHDNDNVLVARRDVAARTPVTGGQYHCRVDIPFGHKIATANIEKDEPLIKYGQVIGFAAEAIVPGDHVHTHNVYLRDFERQQTVSRGPAPAITGAGAETFQGILRPDGQVATRNYLGVISTVNCSASAARLAALKLDEKISTEFPNIDGVAAICHGQGCGGATDGLAYSHVRDTVCGYVRHPNFAGLVILGLGCEILQIEAVLAEVGDAGGKPVHAFNIQDVGGTTAAISRAAELLREMAPAANRIERQSVPLSRLKVGLECGGSDACSGIPANPGLGAAVDRLVRQGATAVMGETSEIFGAEHLLLSRTVDPAVARKLETKIAWWRQYADDNGVELNNNPSPGNKAGGLTNIIEKSLGAVAKGGTTPLRAVLDYAEPIREHGLLFMDTPGYDPASITGMIAGGAHLICFTTGRGSVFGAKPAPVIKLASNSTLYRCMTDDMDINAGAVMDGVLSVDQLGQEIFEAIIASASGTKTKSETLGLGNDEFVPWQIGAVL